MGTRHTTMVIAGEKTKVAQYGQWDGYPSGQGKTVLKIIRRMKRYNQFPTFLKQLEKVRFMTKKDDKAMDVFLKSIGSNDGWMTDEQAVLYHKRYPYMNRDHGATILDLIYHSKHDEILLADSTDFASGKGFGCEWVYVINLDKMTLTFYDGTLKANSVTFDINALPTQRDFMKALEPLEAY